MSLDFRRVPRELQLIKRHDAAITAPRPLGLRLCVRGRDWIGARASGRTRSNVHDVGNRVSTGLAQPRILLRPPPRRRPPETWQNACPTDRPALREVWRSRNETSRILERKDWNNDQVREKPFAR